MEQGKLNFTDSRTVDDVKVELKGALKARRETKCPCCGQRVRVWKKPIISTAVASLVKLVAMYRGEPIHHDDFTVLLKDRNFSQLVWWGLVLPWSPREGTANSAGMWVPTQKGVDFVRGEVTVPTHILTYDNQFICFEGPEIGVKEALRKRFDYENLLLSQR